MPFGFGARAPFAVGFSVSGHGGSRPAAPTLTRTSADSVAAPTFTDLLVNPLEGDIAELWISDNVNFAGTVDVVDVGDISTNPVPFTGPTLADGPWWAKAFTVRSGVYSPPSNVVAFTIATFTVRQFELSGSILNSTGSRTYELPGMTVTEN